MVGVLFGVGTRHFALVDGMGVEWLRRFTLRQVEVFLHIFRLESRRSLRSTLSDPSVCIAELEERSSIIERNSFYLLCDALISKHARYKGVVH